MAAIAAAALLVAVASAACGLGGDGDPSMTGPAGTSSAAPEPPAVTAATSSAADTSSMGREPTTTTASPTTAPPTTTAGRTQLAYPGGTIGADMLAARGRLGDDGRLTLLAPDGTADPALGGAVCSYLLGTTGEIARLTELAAPVTLDPMSGYPDGPQRPLVLCLYGADGTAALAVQFVAGAAPSADAPGEPVLVSDGSLHAALSYSPGYDGPRLAEETAAGWLRQALGLIETSVDSTG